MKTLFQAYDGKLFTNEKECERYEQDNYTVLLESRIVLLDSQRRVVSLSEPDDAYYIWIADTKAAELLQDMIKFYDWPDHAGTYYYDCDIEQWVDLPDRAAQYQHELEGYKDALEVFKRQTKGE